MKKRQTASGKRLSNTRLDSTGNEPRNERNKGTKEQRKRSLKKAAEGETAHIDEMLGKKIRSESIQIETGTQDKASSA